MDEEEQYSADLIRERHRATLPDEEDGEENNENQGSDHQKGISLMGGGLFAGFMFLFFDVPQIILTAIGIGVFINWLITLFGYLTIYIWIKWHGYSLLDAKNNKNVYLFFGSGFIDTISVALPALTVYVILFTLSKKIDSQISKNPVVGKIMKSTANA